MKDVSIIFLSLFLLTELAMSIPKQHRNTKARRSIQTCQRGRVCMDSCYLNDQPVACERTNIVKSIRFEPSFTPRIPSIILRLIRSESYDDFLENDVSIKKENLTPTGMNIHINPLKKTVRDVFCIDWQACSFDSD